MSKIKRAKVEVEIKSIISDMERCIERLHRILRQSETIVLLEEGE